VKALTHAERGRLGGLRTVERYGIDHMREIAARGGQAVVEKHGADHMSEIGKRGFQAAVERRFDGDPEAAKKWLVKAGLAAMDPFPENGAWQQEAAE